MFGSDLLRIGPLVEDIRTLRNELRLSTEAEEKNKRAIGWPSALKEARTEANQVKGKLKINRIKVAKSKS